MILFRNALLVAAAILLIWMNYWAAQYVSLSEASTFQQHLVSAEFDVIADPPGSAWSGDKSDYYKQMAKQQRTAAANARQTLKDLRPSIKHAKSMLTTVSWWATFVLLIFLAASLLGNIRIRIERRAESEQQSKADDPA